MSLNENGNNGFYFGSGESETSSNNTQGKRKTKSPYTEAEYEFMREQTKKMLIERFHLNEEKAQERADLEIRSLKEVFNEMPEFV